MGIFVSKIPERQQEEIPLNENGSSLSDLVERRQPTNIALLYKAALKGDWLAAQRLFSINENLIKTAITEGGEIALHIAAVEGHVDFVSQLLNNMQRHDMEIMNKKGCTALCFAAAAGHVDIARRMLTKHPDLAKIADQGVRPLYMAALQGFDKMAHYLYDKSDIGSWTLLDKVDLLTSAIESELYDLAIKIVTEDTASAGSRDRNGETPLHLLARNSFAFSCDNGQGFWDKIIRNVLPFMKKSNTDNVNADGPANRLFNCLWNAIQSDRNDIEAAHSAAAEAAESAHIEEAGATESAHIEAAEAAESAHIEAAGAAESAHIEAAGAPESAHIEAVGATESAHIEAAKAAESAHIEAAGAAESAHIEAAGAAESAHIEAAGAPESAHIEAAAQSENNEAARADVFYSSKLFFTAARSANDGFLVELFKNDHNLLYKINQDKHSIFHIAVLHRYVNVFNLIYDFRGTKDLIATYVDNDGNNILHLAGKLAPQNQLDSIPGAAWQMQREVLWFKAVEKLVQPAFKHKKNNNKQTPHELFLAEHKMLRAEGEEFLKKTAKSCMLVTMLIATVVFTTAFTVPGGYNNSSGAPVLENNGMFMTFPVSEAVATLSSLISMLMFLSILTSRYSDEDFLKPLPVWMVVGVSTLFFSIVAMMVVFCSCLLFFEHGWVAVTLLLVFFGSVPIMFVVLKYRLLMNILRCTYSSTWLFRSHNRLHS